MAHSTNDAQPDIESLILIDSLCDRIEQEWKSGRKPLLRDFLPEDRRSEYRVLLPQMILVDRWYRQKNDQPSSLDIYLTEFPELGPAESLPAKFVEEFRSPVAATVNRHQRPSAQHPSPHVPVSSNPVPSNSALEATAIGDNAEDTDASIPAIVQNQQNDTPTAKIPESIGRYRIIRVLGQGAFGDVLQARDETLHRDVAIKVPRVDKQQSKELLQMYLEEARSIAKLDHPAIVPIYDVGSTAEFPCFVVSKLIEGMDLKTRLNQGRLPVPDAIRIVVRMAEALHYAHTRGLVHRDVKPANILVDNEGQAYLADFGLALQDDDLGKGATLLGTVAYMSPEQARQEGHRVDGRSDIFSLGVVLYELLTGKRPFRSDDSAELLDQIRAMEAKPPRQIVDGLSTALEQVCMKSLSKSVTERYATARDFAEDLQRSLLPVNQSSNDSNTSLQNELSLWQKHWPKLVGAVLLISTVVGIAFLVPRISDNGVTDVPPNGNAIADSTRALSPIDSVGQPIQVKEFSIKVSRSGGAFKLLEDQVPLQNGDHVHFKVQLSEPAYCRLLWIDAAGNPAEIYPLDPETGLRSSEAVTSFDSPVQLDTGWPVEGGSGMETAVLMVSREPLNDVPVASLPLSPRRTVLTSQPVRHEATRTQPPFVSFAVTDGLAVADLRSLGTKASTVDDPIAKLLELLRQHSDIVQAISVPHSE